MLSGTNFGASKRACQSVVLRRRTVSDTITYRNTTSFVSSRKGASSNKHDGILVSFHKGVRRFFFFRCRKDEAVLPEKTKLFFR